MIALNGFSRFPIFYTSDARHNIGFKSKDDAFNQFVNSLRGNFVAIQSLKNIKYKSRFVLEQKAINPELRKEDFIPNSIYIYPNRESIDCLTNSLTYGITLKGGRYIVFVPLISRRLLSKKEIKSLTGIVKIEEFGLNKFKLFLERLDISFEIEKELTYDRAVIRIEDPEVDGSYRVLINKTGRVLDVDFCIEDYQNLFLPELIFYCRSYGSVYPLSGFHY